ncbi:hypothetical protein [Patiriisocius sp. Uisw_017]|jgi:hypothetical protein|uniref:hypothetical protein n=1 Tax=Patiriisocius sp. Uisw_017 TaxID=3230968 RepID=UPI0039EC6F2C
MTKKIKEATGAFIIAFSKLEYGLASLGVFTAFDLRNRDEYLLTHLGNSFDNKMKNSTRYIDNNLQELKPIWDIQKNKIGQLNRERRFIAHGFISYSLPQESATTFVKEKKKPSRREFNLETTKKLTNELYHLNPGENGINGEFNTEFTRLRINRGLGQIMNCI